MKLFEKIVVQRWKTIDASWRFAITAFFTIRLFYGLWSWVFLTIQPLAVQNFELSGEPILSIFNLQDNQTYVYLREINKQNLTFRPADTQTIVDQQTGSIWDISNGVAVEGPLKVLTLLPSKTVPSDIFPYHRVTPYPVTWLAMWQRFDANWYLSIAENGYGSIKADGHFPPLYPTLIRLMQPFFGSTFLAGLFISHLAALCTIKLLYDLFLKWGGNAVGKRSVIFFLIFPTSFFLFSVYSESMFLLIVLLSFRSMKNRSWVWAGFWAFCSILTRLQGAALLIPMIYLMWLDHPFLRKHTHWLGLSLPVFGGLFYLYLRSRQMSSEIIPFVESDLHTRIVAPWEGYWYGIQTLLSNQYSYIDILNLAIATLFAVILIAGWRKVPLEYNLFTAFNLLIILARITEDQPLTGMSRFALTLFPSFFILSLASENALIRRIVTYTFLLLNLYLSAQFFLWGWVA